MESLPQKQTISKYLRLIVYNYLDPHDIAVKIGSLTHSEQTLINESLLLKNKLLKITLSPSTIPIRFVKFIDELTITVRDLPDGKVIRNMLT